MLATLEKDAKKLEQQIAKAATAGDKATMRKLQRELNSTKRTIDQLKGSATTTDQVLRRLDKASPKELNRALKQLQTQLNGIQRGTAAWDAQVAKIQRVKAELQKVNATLTTQKSLWSRMNSWLNNAQTAIMAFAAAVTGLVMAGRKAVQSYADMEEQMANTIKYTRMTAAEVEELNEIFKGMDTRLAREQLNLLAQEGGRLGYNTVASVKEYVEAASIINVALVDLGEGATQTIAKLSNIFGMEQMYGVRDSMLKIGSTVNHLSQNCTAAKPFIVEFAQRMAGIGSTAKMTIPEIMAFAATLDAHGQKVEMSATALQRTIMELFKKPAEMARKVGIETNSFIETLNKSTTQGVMMFLEALNKLGEDKALAVLSPLFQDLGLDGARVSSVLSNLSSHLDFLKWQLGEASEAFREGTSASNEYAIFNNTVQAAIDKARKRVGELAIELGEKLYPLMKHIYTSSSAFLRVLNSLVDFIIEHRAAIGRLVVVMASYYAGLAISKTLHFAYNAVVKVNRLRRCSQPSKRTRRNWSSR
jgi:TP901 family phage tail tape measure protein